jgi:signal transduction histidine kinase
MRHPPPDTGLHRLQESLQTVQIADCAAEPAYDAVRAQNPPMAAVRTALHVPMLKEGALLGAIMIYRDQMAAFTDKETELVEGFAKQAVIAIENARLIAETQEALDRQTATAEVLGVINSSPGNLAPVFEAILEKSRRFCGAQRGTLFLFDGERFRAAATDGYPGALSQQLREGIRPGRDTHAFAPLLEGARLVHNHDLRELDDPLARAVSGPGGVRTNLLVPLRREGVLLGMISCNRMEVRPFSDKEIALLESFAAQAVVAMENARLITETQEALDQQTATAEVLGVINASPGDLAPVFDAMLEKAMRLVGAVFGGLGTYDGDRFKWAAYRNLPPAFGDYVATHEASPGPRDGYRRIARGDGHVQFTDVRDSRFYREGEPYTRACVELAGARTTLSVPLARDDEVLGVLGFFRQEVKPFNEREIALVKNFAAQAVIAMENARLITETRTARDAAEASLRDLTAAQARLIQAEKMASLGQLTAGIAHEIKNPLNFVNNFAALSIDLLDELKEAAGPALAALDPGQREDVDETIGLLTGNLEKIGEHGRRADNIVKSMLEHSRGVSGERRSVDLNVLVEESLTLAYHGARAQDPGFNITLERDFDAALRAIDLVPQDITRVFLNLFGNGFYAAAKRAKANADAAFRPVLRVATREAGDAVEVRVRDNGTGIPAEIRDKLFQPFFTTKPTGEGTGLGLSISYDIVTQEHGGTITVESEPGAFTEFTIRLPRG